MHPLSTSRRRRLVAASLRLERCIRRDRFLPREIARRRLVRLMARRHGWNWIAL